MTYDINTIYTKYMQLTKKQRQQLLAALQVQGINIVKIEAYEYADAPGIKHLFFYFAEDSRKAIHYFMLDSKVWEEIQRLLNLFHAIPGLRPSICRASISINQNFQHFNFRFF